MWVLITRNYEWDSECIADWASARVEAWFHPAFSGLCPAGICVCCSRDKADNFENKAFIFGIQTNRILESILQLLKEYLSQI